MVGKRGVDWQQVTSCVGKCANRLLVDDSVVLNKEFGVGRYKKNALYSKLMQNSFVYIIKQQIKPFKDFCLIDKKAQATDLLYKLAPYFQHVSVITENKKKYEKVCDNILENTGLCITIQSELQNASVKIDVDRNVMTIINENDVYNISSGTDFKVPRIYENLYDGSVDKLLFYSALYEFCGVFELADLSFDIITINGEKKDINEIIFT